MKMKQVVIAAIAPLLVVLAASCSPKQALLFEGADSYSRLVTANDPMAQRYFDQGLMLSYGFNHDEAEQSFLEASRLDPHCAMAYWGQAYALGPNINIKMDEQHGIEAWNAIQKAVALADRATPVEKELISALMQRYSKPPAKDQPKLDQAYAAAMAEVWRKYPNDPDVGFLYADALMNLHRWDQWTPAPDFAPKEHTLEIIATLDRVLELDINHPGANHYYIHVWEASKEPWMAEAAADRLDRMPFGVGLGHLVHMPGHIYVQVDRFEDTMRVNEEASNLDREYFARAGDQLVYHYYHAHNNHFRVWAALYMGNYEEALEAARLTAEDFPDVYKGDPGIGEWLTMDIHVHLRFGAWQKVLELPRPREDQPYAIAMWHYARGIAFANTERIEEARAEAESFELEVARIPQDLKVFVVSALDVMEIARQMLAGEIEYKAGNVDLGFEYLRHSIVAEDALRYSEPSPWMVPTRHSFGALLLEQGRVAEAEPLYREDLMKHPGNIWSLAGLMECLNRQGRDDDEARTIRIQFERAQANATVDVSGSCFCRTINWTQPGEPL